ncbi:hypothetical protein B0T11DRAFT_280242 [Plectosphaerella cucumerina]|uniref:Uncharacterized protein n=1 Tax=Plectosphaerella cucumerina TaxID=40658 RepID=A0A8K0THE3_9PEZI|nr:hypothetical protein B0T11DRAFT_280242 [Plectosphaerella cucumerina]
MRGPGMACRALFLKRGHLRRAPSAPMDCSITLASVLGGGLAERNLPAAGRSAEARLEAEMAFKNHGNLAKGLQRGVVCSGSVATVDARMKRDSKTCDGWMWSSQGRGPRDAGGKTWRELSFEGQLWLVSETRRGKVRKRSSWLDGEAVRPKTCCRP